ncbi:selenium-binding protein SBP56-related protein [Bacillus sp. V5-8f]|uniref:selenium-binding protein SBP56-related protein n=1 Tax=Bacillus sp. V5-8f TaxID=2053044 RepID=UPI000C79521B|nr:hypothetical protein CUU64_17150 [Bacillus sp. V5-8f]
MAFSRHTIEPEEIKRRTGYSPLHTVHCGPEGIFISALGAAEGDGGPGGILLAWAILHTGVGVFLLLMNSYVTSPVHIHSGH